MNKKKELEEYVTKKVNQIAVQSETSEGKALLANLRHGIGHVPGEKPEIFGILLMDMPEIFYSDNGKPTEGEWASYIALTLYALHQQGFNTKLQPMFTNEKISIGKALAKLAFIENDVNAKERMLQRLKELATSKDMNELSYHLRSVIQLLKREAIELNYSLLAKDLYEFQYPDAKAKVCLRWGQDFYHSNEKIEKEDGGKDNE